MDQAAELECDVASVFEQRRPVGADGGGGLGGRRSIASTTAGRVGTGPSAWPLASAKSTATRSRGRRPRPRQARPARPAVRPGGRPPSSAPGRAEGSAPGPGSSGLSRTAPPGRRATGGPPGVGQGAVLALGVDHPGPAAEHGLAPQVGLDEGALAPADLAEDDHVGVGEHPCGVQLEGVVDEGAPRAGRGRSAPPGGRGPTRPPAGRRHRDCGWSPGGPGPGARAPS